VIESKINSKALVHVEPLLDLEQS
ncbi:MAG: hypothetical protein PWQ68_2388, partial [Thermoanaerobacteraceae bacterium]|nr:hypothetical protein [Thermoanaerobacteraceae bacterium]